MSKKGNQVALRAISAIILAVPALAAIHYGSPFFDILISIVGILMAWEWTKLCLGKFEIGGYLLCALVGVAPFLDSFDITKYNLFYISPLIAICLFVLSFKNEKGRVWFAIGALYLSLPIASFDYLRNIPEHGLAVVYWMALIVWATDTGGFFFGVKIGGPKLAPKISPNKTWAGLIGAMVSAFAVGFICGEIGEWNNPLSIAILSSVLAFVAQMGDLFESYAKRRFDVKDSSQIIPGHGGVLDRLDGMLAAGMILAWIILVTQGHILSWF